MTIPWQTMTTTCVQLQFTDTVATSAFRGRWPTPTMRRSAAHAHELEKEHVQELRSLGPPKLLSVDRLSPWYDLEASKFLWHIGLCSHRSYSDFSQDSLPQTRECT